MSRWPLAFALLALPLPLASCGEKESGQSVSSDQVVREAKAERKRKERIRQLERKIRQGRARRREQDSSAAPSGAGPAGELPGFAALASSLPGQIGITAGAPGKDAAVTLGDLRTGSAWSTIKVPISLRVLERAGGPGGLSSAKSSAMQRALTNSDNAAADQLFGSLGSTSAAAASVTQVLRQAGDSATQVSSQGRGSFSPYGQTEWPLAAQHRFMSSLAAGCVADSASRKYVLDLMGKVASDTWGLGSAGAPARWKGGWGPGQDGRYLARQMGVLDLGGEQLVVTIAALPSDGQFATAQGMDTKAARWIATHGRSLAGSARDC